MNVTRACEHSSDASAQLTQWQQHDFVLSHRAEACERNSFVWSSRYDGIVTVQVAAPHFQKFNSLEAMCVTRVDVAGKRLLVVPRRDDLLLAFNLLYLKK